MSNLKVSVLIPSYNHENFISDAVKSTLGLDYENLEVIILDDFSTDKTYEILKLFDGKNNIKIFRNNKNYGRTYTYRRLLYELSSGDWVIMLDGDDYFIKSNFLKRAVEIIKKHPNLVAVCGGYIKSFNGKKIIRKPPEEKFFEDGLEVSLLYPDIIYAHGAVLYNRKKAIEINSYRAGIMSDDLESHLRLFARGGVYFIDEIVYLWRVHGKNETVVCGYKRYIENIKMMVNMVSDDLKLLRSDKEREIDKWKKRCFFKLYRIAVFVYGVDERIKISKMISDLKSFFDLRYFLPYFILIMIYLIFPLRFLKKFGLLMRNR